MIDKTIINPATGKVDGHYFTHGNSLCAVIFCKLLRPGPKFSRAGSIYCEYREGLNDIDFIPDNAKCKATIIEDWFNKYKKKVEETLSIEEGQTYLVNMMKSVKTSMIRRNIMKQDKVSYTTYVSEDGELYDLPTK